MISKTHKKRRETLGKNNMEEGVIHILAKSIKKRFEELPPIYSKCCIYKVPRTLRNVNLSAYKPCLISIGPLNYGIERLQGMQEQKLRYLQIFLRRNEDNTLKDYLKALKELENDARECYIENISLSSDEFVQMMLLDGCFIIEFFLNWYCDDGTLDDDDRIFGKPSLEHVIRRDLLLIENQLPFFVLERLYGLAFDDGESKGSSIPLTDLASEVLIGKRELPNKFKKHEILHFVDFLRTWFLPKHPRGPTYTTTKTQYGPIKSGSSEGEMYDPTYTTLKTQYGPINAGSNKGEMYYPTYDQCNGACWEFPPGVKDLHDAGVKFVPNKSDSLLDIEFINGVLYIPKIEVEDHTESILLNLSAFEQCHYHFDSYIVDYVLFMDVLIAKGKDVDILVSSGIITNALGNNDEVAHLFNMICRETNYEAHKFYYSEICMRLVAHSKAPWNRWKAILKHTYFNNPWTIISFIAAVVLLVLTVVQTACCVIAARLY